MKVVRSIAIIGCICLVAGGCTSNAVFEGVDPQQACEYLGPEFKPGDSKSWEDDGFMVTYTNWMKIRKIGKAKVQAHAKCTNRFIFSECRDKRREWFHLAMLSEWIQRKCDGRLTSSDLPGLERIGAVDICSDGDCHEVLLAGADKQMILTELAKGLKEIASYNSRSLGLITEKENGFEFKMKSNGTIVDFYANEFELEVVNKSNQLTLRFKTIKQHKKIWVPLELLTRQATVYLLDAIEGLTCVRRPGQ